MTHEAVLCSNPVVNCLPSHLLRRSQQGVAALRQAQDEVACADRLALVQATP